MLPVVRNDLFASMNKCCEMSEMIDHVSRECLFSPEISAHILSKDQQINGL